MIIGTTLADDPNTRRDALERVLASKPFASAGRLARFLRYVVEETLENRGDQIKEYSIGLSVYGKSPDYDPKIDATVRGEACRLRARLMQYYQTEGRLDPLRIQIPKGGYRPCFHLVGEPPPAATVGPPGSIAVLPFQPFLAGDDEAQQALGLAFADALITRIGTIPGLLTLCTSAVMGYLGRPMDAVAIGRSLGVDVVLDGFFQTVGDRIRLSLQLLRSCDGKHMWAGRFDQFMTDMFAAQDAMAEQIVRAIRPEITAALPLPQPGHSGLSSETYVAYAKGRYHLLRYSPEATVKALEAFEQVTTDAPKFAPGFAGLATACLYAPTFLLATHKDAWTRSLSAAQAAVELDGRLPEARAILGAVQLFYGWNWAAARQNLELALAAQPADPAAYLCYGDLLDVTGHAEEALSIKQSALELDPTSSLIHLSLANSCWFAHRYDEVIHWTRQALELDPNNGFALYRQAAACYNLGQHDRWAALAIPLFAQYMGTDPDAIADLRAKYRNGGPARLIRSFLDLDIARRPLTVLAALCVEAGDKHSALTHLESAFTDRDRGIIYLGVDPHWDTLRGDPRFAALLERLNLPPAARLPRAAMRLSIA
jgi:TolB-like protein